MKKLAHLKPCIIQMKWRTQKYMLELTVILKIFRMLNLLFNKYLVTLKNDTKNNRL